MDKFGARIPELGKLRARDITSYLERYRIKIQYWPVKAACDCTALLSSICFHQGYDPL